MKMDNNMEYLVPVDEMIKSLHRKIDDNLWEDPEASVTLLEQELKHFLKLQEEGVIYEPVF